MTTSSVSWLQEWLQAGDAGDLDAFDEYIHSDVIVHAPLGLSVEGLDAEKEVWKTILPAFPDLRHDVQEVVTNGSTIVARVVVTGTHQGEFRGIPATGKRIEIDQAVFMHIRKGKAFEIWEIVDSGALLQQLGVIAP